MMKTLEEILKPRKLDGSKHDQLIRVIRELTSYNNNVISLMTNAYYKLEKNCPGGSCEGDIDLLQFWYNHKVFGLVDSYREVPPSHSTLFLFEMKTKDTSENFKKAKQQLWKSKNMLVNNTHYCNVDCYYSFWSGSNARFEKI
jgi:hypothetical protein